MKKQKEIANIKDRNETIQSAVNRYAAAKNKDLNDEKQLSVICSTMGDIGNDWSKNGERRIYFNDFGVYYNRDNGGFFKTDKYSDPDIDGLYQALADRLNDYIDAGSF